VGRLGHEPIKFIKSASVGLSGEQSGKYEEGKETVVERGIHVDGDVGDLRIVRRRVPMTQQIAEQTARRRRRSLAVERYERGSGWRAVEAHTQPDVVRERNSDPGQGRVRHASRGSEVFEVFSGNSRRGPSRLSCEPVRQIAERPRVGEICDAFDVIGGFCGCEGR